MYLQGAINLPKHDYDLLSGTCVSCLIYHNREICGLDDTGNLSKYFESHDLKDLVLDIVAGVLGTLMFPIACHHFRLELLKCSNWMKLLSGSPAPLLLNARPCRARTEHY